MSEKYQIMSEIEHILGRPGMYMGSTINEIIESWLYQPSSNKIIPVKNCVYNAGLHKLFDEILSNSIDEHRRPDSLFDLNTIHVTVNKDGYIRISDNGGISVKKHKQTGILIPELIFGHLRTSSNYDDTQDRNVVGTNGLGAKLTNIFSSEFNVTTSDAKNSVELRWSNNMRNLTVSDITPTTEHGTTIEFRIDLERFGINELNLSTVRLMQKRCIDACAVNNKLTIHFQSDLGDTKLNSSWHFASFDDYIKLYVKPEVLSNIITTNNGRFKLSLIPDNIGLNSVAFVNGALCCQGTHIKCISKQIVDKIIDYCNKNDMELITEKDILSRLTLFLDCVVYNPTYDSQTKETLTNKISINDLRLNDKFYRELLESELINALKEFYSIKYEEVKRKELRKLNNIIRGTKTTKKLIQSTGNSSNKELWIFEGNSASNGFRKYRNPLTQSAYLLRGKIKNTFNLNKTQIIENQELREIIACLGLQFNEPSKNIKNLKFDKIIIDTDSDYDGHHICGLFLAFITKHFPELIKHNKVYRALSPIIIMVDTKTKEKTYFYTLEDFEHKTHGMNLSKYEIRYTKGLGGLDDEDYSVMLRQQKLLKFRMEDASDFEYINIWFEKSAIERKQLLMEYGDEN